MFFVSNRPSLQADSLVREYYEKTSLETVDALKFINMQVGDYKVHLALDADFQFHEDSRYICFYSGYISGDINNNAFELLESIDFTGGTVRCRCVLGGIFSAAIFDKSLKKIYFFGTESTPNFCYYHDGAYVSVSDNPLFAALGGSSVTHNESYVYQNIACGYSMGEATAFSQVKRAPKGKR